MISKWFRSVAAKSERSKLWGVATHTRESLLVVRGFQVLLFLTGTHALCGSQNVDWREYGGSADSSQYSELNEVNRANVRNLKVAWTYSTGDTNKYSFNPLVVDGMMYVLAKGHSIVALDAANGKELWVHEVPSGTKIMSDRGISYWESKDRADRRLFFASDNLLQAIDARTGKPIGSFGEKGCVDLRKGLGRVAGSLSIVQSTTPGRVFEDMLILGSATNEGYGSAPGDVRAYDVRSGKIRWTFHTVPHPGEFGYETWPQDAWQRVGGANAWSELSLDKERGVIYIPTASPKYNFYGANRHGENLFGDCLLALDARTGKRLWHFQMVHHDIWDYDNATAPKLLTVQHDGQKMNIVAQAGKQGFLWVFDRTTGKPLWPIEERAVPRSNVPGEETWPTQPFPTKPPPFARQSFTVNDLNPLVDDEERAALRTKVQQARNEGLFTPPELSGTIEMPGNNGGSNWGGAAIDPTNGTLYVVSKDLPCLLKLEPENSTPATSASLPQGTRFTSAFGFMFTSTGLPAISPPWASLTAYDLNEGTIKWKIPLGDVPDLAGKTAETTGTVYPKVGPVVTAGGLIFTGTRDKKVRAIDATTGKVIWENQVEEALEGIPAVYRLNGREYIVFCASAQVEVNPAKHHEIHGAYVAFSLP